MTTLSVASVICVSLMIFPLGGRGKGRGEKRKRKEEVRREERRKRSLKRRREEKKREEEKKRDEIPAKHLKKRTNTKSLF